MTNPEDLKQLFTEPNQGQLDLFKNQYYSRLNAAQIQAIEEAFAFNFSLSQQRPKWVLDNSDPQPSLQQFGIDTQAPLSTRLRVLSRLAGSTGRNPAFGGLDSLQRFLYIPGDQALTEIIAASSTTDQVYQVVDIGCGGQVADIELLCNSHFASKRIKVLGIGAFDYGVSLRDDFPELKEKLAFQSADVYSPPTIANANLVFSARTLSYTGLIDTVRFCHNAHCMAAADGVIRIGDIDGSVFNFDNSLYHNFTDFLSAVGKEQPSLKFNANGSKYVVQWRQSEGFPLKPFQAYHIEYDSLTSLPAVIYYTL